MKINRVFAVFFKVFSETQDKIINGSGGGEDIVTPNRLENFFSSDHFVFVFN